MSKLPISKKQIKTSLSYDWYKYVLIIVLISTMWYFFFNLKDGIKPFETIQIFTTTEVKDRTITNELEEVYKDTHILDFKLYTCPKGSDYENYAIENQGLYNSDILIVEKEKCEEALLYKCIEFDADLQNQCLSINPNIEFIKTEDDSIRGLYINKKDNDIYNSAFTLDDFFEFDDDYMISVPNLSFNGGKYSSKGKDEHDMAIVTLLYLLGRTNG